MFNNTKFWYKGHATLHSGLPTLFEGGIPATSAAAALSAVKSMSYSWSCKTVHSIYIYRVHRGGQLFHEPEIFMNYSAEAKTPAEPIVHTRVKKETLDDMLNEANWTVECSHEKVYPTLKFKETAK